MSKLSVDLNPKKEFIPAPTGTHVVRLVQMIDLGNQEFKGKITHNVYLGFELPGEQMENGKPFTVGKEVKLSLGNYNGKDSTLRQIATALKGGKLTEADLADLATNVFEIVGKTGLANICHKTSAKGNVRADLVSIVPLPKGMPIPESTTETTVFKIGDTDAAVIERIPNFLKRKMRIGVGEDTDGLSEVLS